MCNLSLSGGCTHMCTSAAGINLINENPCLYIPLIYVHYHLWINFPIRIAKVAYCSRTAYTICINSCICS